ncbi:MAG: DUF1573 domain-containing protein [Bacteroidota bacterium]|nr:DUF1573 domain-containing protein [Bacteroidota bacterium]
MKKINIILSFALIILLASACNENTNQDGNSDGEISTEDVHNPISADGDGDMNTIPEFDFPVKEYNFGTVIQGEKVSYTFTFTNTGGSELIISNVKASCGCTSPKYSKKPIKPGETGNIEVIFDSHGRSGEQNKTIKVFANTQPKTEELRILCNIVS